MPEIQSVYVSQYGDLEIFSVPSFHDNYIWTLVFFDKYVYVIDPGDMTHLERFFKEHPAYELKGILITHDHHDHTGDVDRLIHFHEEKTQEDYPLEVYCHKELRWNNMDWKNGEEIPFFIDFKLSIHEIPGHTQYDTGFRLQERVMSEEDESEFIRNHMFLGDVHFSAGAGKVFTGTLRELYESFEWIRKLPDDALLYPAHEYTEKNLRFAHEVMPNNEALNERIKNFKKPSLAVTLKEEKATNPFLRLDDEEVKAYIHDKYPQVDVNDPFEVFSKLRQLKDLFL